MRTIGIDQLIGTGKFTDPRLQAKFPVEALRTASVMAFKAMMTLPEEGKNVMSFTQVKQGPQESYMSFIDRLRDAITKQVSSVEAQNALALKLAVENANADCKKVLMALPRDASLVDMVEACNKVGTTSFQMTALAEAFAVALRGDKKCYNCGKPGHLKAQCRAKGKPRQNHSQYRQQTVTPVRVCARCQKGGHTARVCHSKYHKNSSPLPPMAGNSQQSVPVNRATTQQLVGTNSPGAVNPRAVWATAQTGETSRHVQQHLHSAFAAHGIPLQIKTDNGPCYIARTTQKFFRQWATVVTFSWLCDT
ncbi:endogenous retrovirus group K member 6 Gag polyprotein-like [Morphnus guianensis]